MRNAEPQRATPAPAPVASPTERVNAGERRTQELANSLADALTDILRSERTRTQRGAS